MNFKNYTYLSILLVLLVSGCKPEKPLVGIPLTQALSGKGKAPCENLTFGGFPRSVSLEETQKTSNRNKNQDKPTTSFVCRDFYVLNYDTQRNTSLWVVERVTSSQVKGNEVTNPQDETREDPALPPSLRGQKNDYLGIGYQKGFFAPQQDFLFSEVAYSHAYYLSNLFPQHPGQQAVWGRLEEWVRLQAQSKNDLVVISGPVYLNGTGLGWVGVSSSQTGNVKSDHKGKIQVPTHTFKVVIDPKTDQVIAFVVPNTVVPSQTPLSSFVVNVSRLEQASGLVFFPDLPTDQSRVLRQTSLPYWGF